MDDRVRDFFLFFGDFIHMAEAFYEQLKYLNVRLLASLIAFPSLTLTSEALPPPPRHWRPVPRVAAGL